MQVCLPDVLAEMKAASGAGAAAGAATGTDAISGLSDQISVHPVKIIPKGPPERPGECNCLEI